MEKRNKTSTFGWPPGIGKTTMAFLVAKQFGYDMIGLNASDVRSKSRINEILTPVLGNVSVLGTPMIFVDEVDGIHGRGDYGGVAALVDILKEPTVPIILAANNDTSDKMKNIKKVVKTISFKKIPPRLLRVYLENILKLAREKISKGGEDVLKESEEGFKQARIGQYLDTKLKEKPTEITEVELIESYKKYRSVMGTAGRNMALNRAPLADIFYTGMAKAAECVGCGNEIEDSIRDKAAKIPSWPLFYSLKMNDAKRGFEETMKHSESYLREARDALEKLPDNFSHTKFLEFLFLTVEHYNQFWYKKLQEENIWSDLNKNLPRK